MVRVWVNPSISSKSKWSDNYEFNFYEESTKAS